MLQKPKKLQAGDLIATASLSSGMAGEDAFLARYLCGKSRVEGLFDLKVTELPHTLKGEDYVHNHPEERARDLADAFMDESIKGIFSCIGGEDSLRMIPYIDYESIRNHPKIFLGYSDSTITHLICYKAGIMSYYGPSILAEFAENGGLFKYTEKWVKKVLFSDEPIGEVEPPAEWTSEFIPWEAGNEERPRKMLPNGGYEVLQGTGIKRGRLLGGCMEVLEMAKGTEIWPAKAEWEGKLIFFETSEEKTSPEMLRRWLRNYGVQGIFEKAAGLLFAKPYDEQYYEEYKEVILEVVCDELGLCNLPIFYNMSFGHTAPMSIMPYGAMAEIDCEQKKFRIVESGVC